MLCILFYTGIHHALLDMNQRISMFLGGSSLPPQMKGLEMFSIFF